MRLDDFFDLDNFFEDKFDSFFSFEPEYKEKNKRQIRKPDSWTPLGDVYEDSKSFKFKIDLPGVLKNQIRVKTVGNKLMIEGYRIPEKEEENCIYHHVERYYGPFSKEFEIPENVLPDKISAELKDGQLIVTLPKDDSYTIDNSKEIKIK